MEGGATTAWERMDVFRRIVCASLGRYVCEVTEDGILGRKWDKGKGGFEGEREEQLGGRETDPELLRTKGAGVRKPW